jgi:hypothetical protein
MEAQRRDARDAVVVAKTRIRDLRKSQSSRSKIVRVIRTVHPPLAFDLATRLACGEGVVGSGGTGLGRRARATGGGRC